MSESLTDDGSLSQQDEKSKYGRDTSNRLHNSEILHIIRISGYSFREDSDRPKKVELGPKKIIGIGPTSKEGIPLVLRSVSVHRIINLQCIN